MAKNTSELSLIQTGDGSSSLYHQALEETYHSRHGAIAESKHVFVNHGLDYRLHLEYTDPQRHNSKGLSILEMGFGTGLNALLTLLHQKDRIHSRPSSGLSTPSISINYTALEAFPLPSEIYHGLDYAKQLGCEDDLFYQLHQAPWEVPTEITPGFNLIKKNMRFQEYRAHDKHDIIYYDAFGARVQPELWEKERFKVLYASMRAGGVFVTYAAKGSVRRALQEVGFAVERLAGPPGKREMLRGTKP